MKDQKFGPIPVLLLTLAGGLAGFVLRLMMLTVGYDAQGVQIPGSWPMVSLWVLSGVVLIGLAALCLGMGKRAGLEENFKASPVAGAGAMVAGLVFFVCSLVQLLDKPDLFSMVVYALGLGGGSALAYNGYLRLSGKVSAPAGMLVSLYLAALLICRFRGWSADPAGRLLLPAPGHGCLHGGCLSAGRLSFGKGAAARLHLLVHGCRVLQLHLPGGSGLDRAAVFCGDGFVATHRLLLLAEARTPPQKAGRRL